MENTRWSKTDRVIWRNQLAELKQLVIKGEYITCQIMQLERIMPEKAGFNYSTKVGLVASIATQTENTCLVTCKYELNRNIKAYVSFGLENGSIILEAPELGLEAVDLRHLIFYWRPKSGKGESQMGFDSAA